MPSRPPSQGPRREPSISWGARWRCLRRALTCDHSAITWPWLRSSNSDGVGRLHRLALELDWNRVPTLESRLCLRAVSLLWPVMSLGYIAREVHRHGAFVARTSGVSRLRQARQMAALAARYNCPPSSYYKFQLFRRRDPGPASQQFIHAFEIGNLLPAVNPPALSRLLDNKQWFFEEARRQGLPVAPLTVTFREGVLERWYVQPARLPERDLVLKAFNLNCGAQFEGWEYVGGSRWRHAGRQLDHDALLARGAERSADRGCLIQERLFNHPQLARLAGRGLCTVRIVTHRYPRAAPVTFMACFRMPTDAAQVDNFAAGGIAAPVDMATGELGPAVGKSVSRGSFERHPDSGAAIAGVTLPDWDAAKALALRAHSGFSEAASIGWDVVLTPSGPLLLEANPTWCVDLLQIPHRTPLGTTAFADVCLEHLAPEGRPTDAPHIAPPTALPAGL